MDQIVPETSTPPSGSEPRAEPRARRRRAPGAYLNLPLWQRFALTIGVAIALLVAMVIFVDHNNTNSNPTLNEASEVRANEEAEVLIEQDQAPHTLAVAAGAKPAAALERAIHARIAGSVATGAIDGPVQSARCQRTGSAPGRIGFSCAVVAAHVTYPFVGVVDQAARRLTFCKRDPPPAPSDNVPVSGRCRL